MLYGEQKFIKNKIDMVDIKVMEHYILYIKEMHKIMDLIIENGIGILIQELLVKLCHLHNLLQVEIG